MKNTRRRLYAETLETRQLLTSVSMSSVAIGPQQQLIAGLRIDDATDLRAAEVRIHYDPNALRTSQQNIRAGALWNDKASVVAKVDESAGIITAFVFSAEPIDATTGDLLDIYFEPTQCTPHSQMTPIDIQEVRINERQITLVDEPIASSSPIDQEQVISPESIPHVRDVQNRRVQQFHGPLRPGDIDAVMQHFQMPLLHQQFGIRVAG